MMDERIKTWWTQQIDVRDMRSKAREWLESEDSMDRYEGEIIMTEMRGKRGKFNYVECAYNKLDYIQTAFTRLGYEILNEDLLLDLEQEKEIDNESERYE
jgi:hypothetical protein